MKGALLSRAIRRTVLPQFAKRYSSIVAASDPISKLQSVLTVKSHAAHGHGHHGGFLKINELKHLSDMVTEDHDSHLTEKELADKTFLKLKELEAEVYEKIARFNAHYGLKAIPMPDPRTWPAKLTDPLFLGAALCFLLFAIFLYNQFIEFAHEMSFEIRDGLWGVGFYFLLGLHGTHVIVGTGMLAILTWMAWAQTVSPQSVYLRCASLYIHLVDLVFVFIVFAVYGGQSSPDVRRNVTDKVPRGKKIVSVDETGKVTEEDLL